jgi:hypothetical protein
MQLTLGFPIIVLVALAGISCRPMNFASNLSNDGIMDYQLPVHIQFTVNALRVSLGSSVNDVANANANANPNYSLRLSSIEVSNPTGQLTILDPRQPTSMPLSFRIQIAQNNLYDCPVAEVPFGQRTTIPCRRKQASTAGERSSASSAPNVTPNPASPTQSNAMIRFRNVCSEVNGRVNGPNNEMCDCEGSGSGHNLEFKNFYKDNRFDEQNFKAVCTGA